MKRVVLWALPGVPDFVVAGIPDRPRKWLEAAEACEWIPIAVLEGEGAVRVDDEVDGVDLSWLDLTRIVMEGDEFRDDEWSVVWCDPAASAVLREVERKRREAMRSG